MASEVETLVEMGFDRQRAERALTITNNKGVEPAMEWLLAHADDPEPEPQGSSSNDGESSENTSEQNPESTTTEQAKSIRCEDCGKLFKTQDEVQFHAVKSGHENFSESTEEKKPLTEEERKEQLAKLEEKIKQKRKEREEKERIEVLEKEKLRIKSGRDMQDAKQRLQEQEMKKIVEQRRKDKIEDQKAKERVRQQIQADREARKMASEKQTNQETTPPPVPSQAPVVTSTTSTPNKPAPTSARLQLRLPDGRAITQEFSAREQLSAVRLFLHLNEMKDTPFNLMTTFPSRVFTDDDYDKPLDILGLVPSAVVIVKMK